MLHGHGEELAETLSFMQVVEGWRSCAEGALIGRSAVSASSAPSSEERRKDRRVTARS